MQPTADVVIIGAGVIGCSTAYHLAQRGITNVAVVEMDQVGSGTSSKSASMLSLQFGRDELCLRMAKYSYARYMAFEAELGTPIDFKRTGWLSLATEGSARHLLEVARLTQSAGVKTEILEPQDIKRLYPEINVEDVVLGTFGPDDGPLDPHMIMWGYIERAREKGIRLYQGVRATGVELEKGSVKRVQTDEGPISTPVVVNAAGPWASEVGGWVGVGIPIVNRVRSVLVTGPLTRIPRQRPFVEDVSTEWYYRPEGEGVLMGMGAEPTEKLDVQVSPEMIDRMIDVAVHRVPALERATVLTTWAGVRPLTPDDRPIVGPAPQVEGLILNCGWGGMGIIQAPIAGQLVAEYVSEGRVSTIEASAANALSIARFSARAVCNHHIASRPQPK